MHNCIAFAMYGALQAYLVAARIFIGMRGGRAAKPFAAIP